MLAPFFMKAHGYSVALAGIPLVANGLGRVCSDLFSGVMATYFSAAHCSSSPWSSALRPALSVICLSIRCRFSWWPDALRTDGGYVRTLA